MPGRVLVAPARTLLQGLFYACVVILGGCTSIPASEPASTDTTTETSTPQSESSSGTTRTQQDSVTLLVVYDDAKKAPPHVYTGRVPESVAGVSGFDRAGRAGFGAAGGALVGTGTAAVYILVGCFATVVTGPLWLVTCPLSIVAAPFIIVGGTIAGGVSGYDSNAVSNTIYPDSELLVADAISTNDLDEVSIYFGRELHSGVPIRSLAEQVHARFNDKPDYVATLRPGNRADQDTAYNPEPDRVVELAIEKVGLFGLGKAIRGKNDPPVRVMVEVRVEGRTHASPNDEGRGERSLTYLSATHAWSTLSADDGERFRVELDKAYSALANYIAGPAPDSPSAVDASGESEPSADCPVGRGPGC